MSMCRKAYAFDYTAFARELAPALFESLATGSTERLVAFVDDNLVALTCPWDASPLPNDWRAVVREEDVQEIGDYCLTKYYDTDDDGGLQESWIEIYDKLPAEAKPCALGKPFGPPENLFDPGRGGSYFQNSADVLLSRDSLSRVDVAGLEPYLALLERATQSRRGLYATF